MIAIPYQVNDNSISMLIILEKDNVDRMKAYDPGCIETDKFPPEWRGLPMDKILLAYASDEDMAIITPWMKSGEVDKIFSHISKGWEFKPNEGDNDDNYKIINEQDNTKQKEQQ